MESDARAIPQLRFGMALPSDSITQRHIYSTPNLICIENVGDHTFGVAPTHFLESTNYHHPHFQNHPHFQDFIETCCPRRQTYDKLYEYIKGYTHICYSYHPPFQRNHPHFGSVFITHSLDWNLGITHVSKNHPPFQYKLGYVLFIQQQRCD